MGMFGFWILDLNFKQTNKKTQKPMMHLQNILIFFKKANVEQFV